MSEEWTAIARQHWARAGVDDRIQLAIAPGPSPWLPASRQAVDLAFVDADGRGCIDYY